MNQHIEQIHDVIDERNAFVCYNKWWKVICVAGLVLNIVLSIYWYNQLGTEFMNDIIINLTVSLWTILYLFVPDLSKNKTFIILAYSASIVFILVVIYAVYLILTFSPYQLYAIIFLFYSGLTGTVLSVVLIVNLLLDSVVTKFNSKIFGDIENGMIKQETLNSKLEIVVM